MQPIVKCYKFLAPTKLKAPFGWVGGKSKLAQSIVSLMPPHKRYIEVFGGGLSVLYAKPSRRDIMSKGYNVGNLVDSKGRKDKYVEVINDTNNDLINLHTIIKTNPQTFSLYLNNMLCSREIFERIKRGSFKAKSKIEKAVLYYYLLTFSFASKGDNFAMCKARSPKNIYKDYSIWSERLKGVCIENMDFRKLIKEYDSEESLFYLDPPYVGTENYYKMPRDFGMQEHKDLADILHSIKGKFILSYNDCKLIRELYKDLRIKQTKEIRYSMNVQVRKVAKEVLIMNY